MPTGLPPQAAVDLARAAARRRWLRGAARTLALPLLAVLALLMAGAAAWDLAFHRPHRGARSK